MVVHKIKNRQVVFQAPSSKAHTLRALILSALAEGESRITSPLLGEDQLHLIECLRNLGVDIRETDEGLLVKGSGGRFAPVHRPLDCGESGVSMNVLIALACLAPGEVILTGAEGLLKRPVSEVVKGLRQLGAEISYSGREDFPPVVVTGDGLAGGSSEIRGGKTSQYFSSLAMVAPCAAKETLLVCADEMTERPYFDITREMMERFGVQLANRDYKRMEITPQTYRAADMRVEGDFSSASFFMAAAAVCGSRVAIGGLNRDSRQGDQAMIDYLIGMDCSCTWEEEVLLVEGRPLKAIARNMSDTPDLVPPMAVVAAFADGVSEFSGVAHLQFKECNRLEALISELGKMGVRAWFQEDSLFIEGNSEGIRGAKIDSWNDHRIAMSFAVAGLVTGDQEITHPGCVAKSFPDFWERFKVFYEVRSSV